MKENSVKTVLASGVMDKLFNE